MGSPYPKPACKRTGRECDEEAGAAATGILRGAELGHARGPQNSDGRGHKKQEALGQDRSYAVTKVSLRGGS